jgi:hypothetical protein
MVDDGLVPPPPPHRPKNGNQSSCLSTGLSIISYYSYQRRRSVGRQLAPRRAGRRLRDRPTGRGFVGCGVKMAKVKYTKKKSL